MYVLTPPHTPHLTHLGFRFRQLESILAAGAASARPRPMAMTGPYSKEKIDMLILHDAASSQIVSSRAARPFAATPSSGLPFGWPGR